MSEKIKCSQCGEVLKDEMWANYYCFEWDNDNMLCGDGDCWAGWMQNNTHSHEIEREETDE